MINLNRKFRCMRSSSARRLGAAALASAAFACLTGPAGASAATYCSTPSVTYAGQGNFFNVFHETLSAEVCHDGYHNPWVIWTSHRFSGLPGWSGTELGRGVFWDPYRYGGSTTIWSNDADTFGWGPASYTEDTYLRIWVTRSGQVYTFGGL
jgi:hypothetical protein